MKTIRVQYDEPARSKSRNVNAYTRAYRQHRALSRACIVAGAAEFAMRGKLTGGQLAEARRLLAEIATPMGGAA